LTGEAPFQGDNIHGIMYQILNSTPPPPSVRNAELPHIVDLVVAKALAKNVEDRYQSAKELIEDLRECKNVVQGFVTTQPLIRTTGNGAPPAPSATRREDKVLSMTSAGAKPADGGAEKQGLALSKAFDSYEATMRLAAMTGMDNALGELPRSHAATAAAPPTSEAKEPGAADTIRRKSSEPVAGRGSKRAGGTSIWAWVIAAGAIAVAVAVMALAR
jgi:serine/threonine-protein kinase